MYYIYNYVCAYTYKIIYHITHIYITSENCALSHSLVNLLLNSHSVPFIIDCFIKINSPSDVFYVLHLI